MALEVIEGRIIMAEEAIWLTTFSSPAEVMFLAACANLITWHKTQGQVTFCAIINARSGKCPENCSFCAQSSHFQTDADTFSLLPAEEIVESAAQAAKWGAGRFGIVTSGRGVRLDHDLDQICSAISDINARKLISPCASLGILNRETARKLKEAGLVSYHHNLETSAGFFPEICSTHAYQDRVETVKVAQEAGFRVCSGGIWGLGESISHRLEMAFTLRDLGVDSVPVNFLNPIEGTKLANQPPLAPLTILQSLAIYRFILPRVDIRTCGGRERNLRGLQAMMFTAGADSTMIGNYLTTAGRSTDMDLADVTDLGLVLSR
ncbi:MAG: biotin synthase BioB [Deltaproteobacteria bacterium]|nr:biotin synthase BioB [Deltaproteobacteria bacterium]